MNSAITCRRLTPAPLQRRSHLDFDPHDKTNQLHLITYTNLAVYREIQHYERRQAIKALFGFSIYV